MQALLVVDFLQELPDQNLGFLEVAVLGAVDFLVFESLDETLCSSIVVRALPSGSCLPMVVYTVTFIPSSKGLLGALAPSQSRIQIRQRRLQHLPMPRI